MSIIGLTFPWYLHLVAMQLEGMTSSARVRLNLQKKISTYAGRGIGN